MAGHLCLLPKTPRRPSPLNSHLSLFTFHLSPLTQLDWFSLSAGLEVGHFLPRWVKSVSVSYYHCWITSLPGCGLSPNPTLLIISLLFTPHSFNTPSWYQEGQLGPARPSTDYEGLPASQRHRRGN